MADAAGHPVPFRLDYRAETTAPAHRRWRVASLIVMLPALFVPFVPFACNSTPLLVTASGPPVPPWDASALQDLALWLTSIPFILAFPIVLWKARRLATPRDASNAERAVCLVLGGIGALAVIGVIGLLAPTTVNLNEWVLLTLPAVTLLLGALVFARLAARRSRPDGLVSIALICPYAANTVFCLLCWHSYAQAGWFLTLPPAAAALGEMLATGVASLAPRGGSNRPPD